MLVDFLKNLNLMGSRQGLQKFNTKILPLCRRLSGSNPSGVHHFQSCRALQNVSWAQADFQVGHFKLHILKTLPNSLHLLQQRFYSSVTARSFSDEADGSFGHHPHGRPTDVNYDDLCALLESGDILLVDVREPKELQQDGKIAQSINIPLSEFKTALQMSDDKFTEHYKCEKPQKQASNVVFYSAGIIRSNAALEIAHKLGYKKARHYIGGYEEWMAKQKELQEQKKATS